MSVFFFRVPVPPGQAIDMLNAIEFPWLLLAGRQLEDGMELGVCVDGSDATHHIELFKDGTWKMLTPVQP